MTASTDKRACLELALRRKLPLASHDVALCKAATESRVKLLLWQNGQPAALEIKAGSTVTGSDAAGIRSFRASLKQSQHLVRGVVLHAGHGRPLDTDILALPWGWMVAAEWT